MHLKIISSYFKLLKNKVTKPTNEKYYASTTQKHLMFNPEKYP